MELYGAVHCNKKKKVIVSTSSLFFTICSICLAESSNKSIEQLFLHLQPEVLNIVIYFLYFWYFIDFDDIKFFVETHCFDNKALLLQRQSQLEISV